MDDMLAWIEGAAEDPAILGLLLGLSGLGLVAVMAFGVLQGRSDIRRRATEGTGGERAASGRGSGGAADGNRSLERLMTYLETTFAHHDERQTKVLRLKLTQAGFYHQRAPAVFFACRIAAAFAFGLGSLMALPFVLGETTAPTLWLYAAGLGGLGYMLPGLYLGRRIAARTREHRVGFPDFMDLMVVCAEAGLSMEAAIDRIARELVEGYPSLAENLYMVTLEMRAGKPFTDALQRFGERVGIDEATMLATLLQQSSELGTSLSQSLRVYSDEMRHKRLSRAEEKAHALPAKLVVPLMLFVFPVLLLTLMLPVGIRLSEAF